MRNLTPSPWLVLPLFVIVGMMTVFPVRAQLDQTPWYLEVEWEIGGEESEVYFTSPRDLVIGTGDRVYLSDRREPVIRVLTRTGEEVMTIGQEGQGPGEFSEVTSMLAMPDGGVLVHDQHNDRMSQFDAEGELIRTIKIPEATEGRNWLAAYDEPTDRLVMVKEMPRGVSDEPLIYWVDLERKRLGEGVLRPSELIDIDDAVHAFTANSTLSWGITAFQGDEREFTLLVFPVYYSGEWSIVSFSSGVLGDPKNHFPEPIHMLHHATKVNVSEAEWQQTVGGYGSALASYSQTGVNYADIHTKANLGLRLDSAHMGIVFLSEEIGMDGYWVDVFTTEGELVGRHPITHNLNSITETGVSLFASNGLGEVYFLYYTPDMVPIIGRGRLVPQD